MSSNTCTYLVFYPSSASTFFLDAVFLSRYHFGLFVWVLFISLVSTFSQPRTLYSVSHLISASFYSRRSPFFSLLLPFSFYSCLPFLFSLKLFSACTHSSCIFFLTLHCFCLFFLCLHLLFVPSSPFHIQPFPQLLHFFSLPTPSFTLNLF